MRVFRILAIALVGVTSCSHYQAPAPRTFNPLSVGRLHLVPLASWALPEKVGILRNAVIAGDHLYALFDNIDGNLLKWDLREPGREAEAVFSKARIDLWEAALAVRGGKPVLVCSKPQTRDTVPRGVDAIDLGGSAKRSAYDLTFDDPFFAYAESVPHWFIPHHSRMDLLVGITRDDESVVLTRIKGIDMDAPSLARAGDSVRVAFVDDSERLCAVEVTADGASRSLEYGENNVRETRVVRHGAEWVVTYIQKYRTLGVRIGDEQQSMTKRFDAEVTAYDAISAGNDLVILAAVFDESLAVLRRDGEGRWREYRAASQPIRYLKLFRRDQEVLCFGRIDNTRAGLYRLELTD